MLSLKELRRAAGILADRYTGHRVERWIQPNASELAFSIYGRESDSEQGSKRFLLLSAREGLARVSELERLPRAPERPPAFSSYLRAHLSRAVLRGVEILDDDRQLLLRFAAREGEYALLLSIFGRRSNLYVLDSEGAILVSLRPLDVTRPELAVGAPYRNPSGGGLAEGRDRFAEVEPSDLLSSIEAHYDSRRAEQQQSDLGTSLLQVLRREAKSARRRVEKLEAELAEAELAEDYARQGELLKGAMGRVAQGDSEVRVEDYESGEEVVIPLDPARSPKENLQAVFKRYQKLLRRLTKAGGRIDSARAWLEDLDTTIEGIGSLLEGELSEERERALNEIAERPEIRKLLSKRAAATGRPAPVDVGPTLPARLRSVPSRLLPRRYASRDGLEIWVGRSDAGNDYLTTRLARGNDLFFHVSGSPGSHVILRTEGRLDPPSESLLDACELAVRFSKLKNAGSASVGVVPIKQVKKPKGAKPGLVYTTGGKTIQLRREEARLARVLESKIE